jgi:hypothetical protein
VETLLFSESESSGIRADILEKDCHTILILTQLANKQDRALPNFKGGTSLYKAIGSLRTIKTHLINRLPGKTW